MRTVITGGLVVDGVGGEGPGTVVIADDRIEAVSFGKVPVPIAGAKTIDVSGWVVAPGLIDMHSHDDVAATDPAMYEAKLRQGVTTALIGLDGLGYAPVDRDWQRSMVTYWTPVNGDPGVRLAPDLATYADGLKHQIGINVVLGAPHGNFRIRVGGWDLRPLGAEALARMVRDVEAALDAGAYGLTTGLGYVPAMAADASELRRVAEPLAARKKIYASHIRSYGLEMKSALEEALDLGRRLGIHVHLSHLHLSHPAIFGQADHLLEYLKRQRQSGLSVSFDLYPYSAGSSVLHSYLPSWLLDGGPDRALARLADGKMVERMRADPRIRLYDWSRVRIARSRTGNYVGMSVAAAADAAGTDPSAFLAAYLVAERLEIGVVVHQTLEADDIVLAEAEDSVVGSDGLGYGQRPHPRYYGAFAAFYDRHVNQRKTMTMVEALAKMSTKAADIIGLDRRGRLVPGAYADLFVFDPQQYRARSTYEAPSRFAEGVKHVFVNGAFVLAHGQFDGTKRPGRVLSVS